MRPHGPGVGRSAATARGDPSPGCDRPRERRQRASPPGVRFPARPGIAVPPGHRGEYLRGLRTCSAARVAWVESVGPEERGRGSVHHRGETAGPLTGWLPSTAGPGQVPLRCVRRPRSPAIRRPGKAPLANDSVAATRIPCPPSIVLYRALRRRPGAHQEDGPVRGRGHWTGGDQDEAAARRHGLFRGEDAVGMSQPFRAVRTGRSGVRFRGWTPDKGIGRGRSPARGADVQALRRPAFVPILSLRDRPPRRRTGVWTVATSIRPGRRLRRGDRTRGFPRRRRRTGRRLPPGDIRSAGRGCSTSDSTNP